MTLNEWLLRPRRPFDPGEGEAGGETGGEGSEGGEGTGSGEGSGDGTGSQEQPSGEVTLADLPEAWQNTIKDLRKESAGHRTKLRATEKQSAAMKDAITGIAKALGIKVEGDEPSPEELQSALSGKDQTIRQLKIENRFAQVAVAEKADHALTWAVLQAEGNLASLDPESDTFTDDLASMVQEALTKNPKLKAGQAPPERSGGEFGGGTSDHIFTRAEIEAMTPDQRIENLAKIEDQLARGLIK